MAAKKDQIEKILAHTAQIKSKFEEAKENSESSNNSQALKEAEPFRGKVTGSKPIINSLVSGGAGSLFQDSKSEKSTSDVKQEFLSKVAEEAKKKQTEYLESDEYKEKRDQYYRNAKPAFTGTSDMIQPVAPYRDETERELAAQADYAEKQAQAAWDDFRTLFKASPSEASPSEGIYDTAAPEADAPETCS